MYIPCTISLAYFFSLIFFLFNIWKPKERIPKVGFYLGILGFLFHTYYLYKIMFEGIAHAGGLTKSLTIFAWFILLVFLISQMLYKLPSLGAFIFSLAFVGTVPSLVVPHGVIVADDPTINNPWILVHVIIVLLASAIFAIAFVAGVFYLFEEGRIKEKRLSRILQQLPSLNTLDKVNHIGLMIGFPMITVGMAVGFFVANQVWGSAWNWGNKETLSVVTWSTYAILLNCRLSFGWKGKKSALGAIIGFGIIIITLINTA